MMGRDEVKEWDTVRVYIHRIARDTSELVYIWYRNRVGNMEILDNENVKYI